MKKLMVVSFIIVLFLARIQYPVASGVQTPPPAAPQKNTPVVIKAESPDGSYYELGYNHGKALAAMEKDIAANIKKFINTERLYYNDMDPDYRISVLEKNLPARYKEEMRGFADSVDSLKNGGTITYKDILFINLIGDVTRSRLMCSAAAVRANDGLWAGRNFDWKDGGTFHRFAGITLFKCGKKNAVSFGMTGVSSINTGMNKQGVFIAVLGAIQKKDAVFTGKDSVIFAIRYALEESSTAKKAVDLLKKGEYPYSCIFLIADGKDAFFLEKSGKKSALISLPSGKYSFIDSTNHFVKLKNDRKDEDSRIRYEDISDFLRLQKNKPGLQIMKNTLSLCTNREHPVYIKLTPERINKQATLMSIITKPGSGTVYIWFATGAPAPEKPDYTKMDLKKYF
ncbi:MAG: C45 family peptidase [Firmicutes bacterium]|nr:C45 family peptidase [Bacillota bacterium]